MASPRKKSQTFERSQRLQKAWMFGWVHDKGKFTKGRFLNLWAHREDSEKLGNTKKPKIGIVVSRKTSHKAHERNLWKRRIREAFRKNQEKILPGSVVLIQSRAGKKTPSYIEIAQEMLELLQKAKCLKHENDKPVSH